MSDERGLLAQLRRLIAGDGESEESAESPAPSPPYGGDEVPPDCREVDEIPCREAVERVYEYLDGELGEARAEEVRCHVEQCKRCYPMYNWERMFLDFIRGRADRGEASPDLRRKVEALLDREAGGGSAGA